MVPRIKTALTPPAGHIPVLCKLLADSQAQSQSQETSGPARNNPKFQKRRARGERAGADYVGLHEN